MRYKRNVLILAGHYCLAPELNELSNEGDSEKLSFETGVSQLKEAKDQGYNAQLFVWVNDIGIDPGTREQYRSEKEKCIPPNYQEIANSYGVCINDLQVVMESVTRNRAKKELKKAYKRYPEIFNLMDANDSSLVRCVEDATCEVESIGTRRVYAIDGPDEENLVVKEGPNPKCNLILATLFHTLSATFDNVEVRCFFNEIYENRLRLGLHVYSQLFCEEKVPVTTYFCSDTNCFKSDLEVKDDHKAH